MVDVLTHQADHMLPVLRGDQLAAPELLDYEFLSGVRAQLFRGEVSLTLAYAAIGDFDDLPIRRFTTTGAFRHRAFALRDNVTAYGAAYVVLAEALDVPLLTRDARLARSTGHDARIELV